MNERIDRDTGRLAAAIGAVAAGSAACLATFFVVGDPFGTLNDLGNAVTGVLSAALAWRLRHAIPGRSGDLAVGAATIGGVLTVVGSGLVVSGTTGYFLAGLVSSVGFAGIGAFVAVLNGRGTGTVGTWPRRLRTLGTVAGSLMSLGIVMLPGIAARLDDMETAPPWVWVGYLGWLGTFVLYPAWALWMGSVETRRARSVRRAELRPPSLSSGAGRDEESGCRWIQAGR